MQTVSVHTGTLCFNRCRARWAAHYGDPAGEKIYSKRDLYLHYQQLFIQETGLVIHHMNDGRQHFSRRF